MRKPKVRSLEKFLADLKKVAKGYKWHKVGSGGRIEGIPIHHRNSPKTYVCYCPITAVARTFHVANEGMGNFMSVGEKLHLSDNDIKSIVWSNDDEISSSPHFSLMLRIRIREAVGL